eukprot:9098769-Pyramimonas_sp.AAC.1
MTLADSLPLSGRMRSAGAWTRLTTGEAKLLHGEVMNAYRAAARVRLQEARSQVSDARAFVQL